MSAAKPGASASWSVGRPGSRGSGGAAPWARRATRTGRSARLASARGCRSRPRHLALDDHDTARHASAQRAHGGPDRLHGVAPGAKQQRDLDQCASTLGLDRDTTDVADIDQLPDSSQQLLAGEGELLDARNAGGVRGTSSPKQRRPSPAGAQSRRRAGRDKEVPAGTSSRVKRTVRPRAAQAWREGRSRRAGPPAASRVRGHSCVGFAAPRLNVRSRRAGHRYLRRRGRARPCPRS
jgi:hypothetical protein